MALIWRASSQRRTTPAAGDMKKGPGLSTEAQPPSATGDPTTTRHLDSLSSKSRFASFYGR